MRGADGKVNTVRYDAVNAMLLNGFLKEHKKVEQLQVTVAQQQKEFQAAIAKLKEAVTAQLNEQTAQIQKVSAQLELRKHTPQAVLNGSGGSQHVSSSARFLGSPTQKVTLPPAWAFSIGIAPLVASLPGQYFRAAVLEREAR